MFFPVQVLSLVVLITHVGAKQAWVGLNNNNNGEAFTLLNPTNRETQELIPLHLKKVNLKDKLMTWGKYYYVHREYTYLLSTPTSFFSQRDPKTSKDLAS